VVTNRFHSLYGSSLRHNHVPSSYIKEGDCKILQFSAVTVMIMINDKDISRPFNY
jgi:hypothetical protein